MTEYRKMSHSVSRLTVHLIWVTKYRYHVLQGDIQIRTRDLLVQICNSESVQILKGVVSKDHVHVHIEYPPSISISSLIKKMKGRISHLLQIEFPLLCTDCQKLIGIYSFLDYTNSVKTKKIISSEVRISNLNELKTN